MTKHRSFGLVLLEHHQPPRKSLIYALFGHDGHDTTILGFPCHRFERCKPEYADLWLGRSGSSCHYMATWSKAWPFVVGYDPEKHVIKTVKFRECGQRSKVSKEKIKKPCVVLSVYLFFGKSAPSQYSLEPLDSHSRHLSKRQAWKLKMISMFILMDSIKHAQKAEKNTKKKTQGTVKT